ncbi:MAG: VanZ family protein [Deinococcales bacterium]
MGKWLKKCLKALDKLPQGLFGLLALLWAAVIFYFSHSSNAHGVGFLVSPWDKILHAAAYSFLTGLIYLETRRVALSFLLSLGYGFSDEIHQQFVPGRSLDPLDLMADGLGAMLALYALGWLDQQRLNVKQLVKLLIWLMTFAWALFVFKLSTAAMWQDTGNGIEATTINREMMDTINTVTQPLSKGTKNHLGLAN